MSLGNAPTRYGSVSRALHWLTALVILAAIPAGLLANRLPYATDDEIARTILLFSTHKSLGIAALALGLARITWSLSQPRPVPLQPERRWETFLAITIHWTLSICLVTAPLAGWAFHAATPGLAPIWWPFGQTLPFIPQNPAVAEGFGAIHRALTKLLAAALLLHIAGAAKHALIDRDATLARMVSGTPAGEPHPVHHRAPFLTAAALWTATLVAGLLLGIASTVEAVHETREWPLQTVEAALLDDTGKTLGTAATLSFLLVLDPDAETTEKGKLDIVVPIDAMEGDGVDAALSLLIFPIVSFNGTVSGTPPDLRAQGAIESSGVTADAAFTVTLGPSGAEVTGTVPVPGAPLQIRIDATTLRP